MRSLLSCSGNASQNIFWPNSLETKTSRIISRDKLKVSEKAILALCHDVLVIQNNQGKLKRYQQKLMNIADNTRYKDFEYPFGKGSQTLFQAQLWGTFKEESKDQFPTLALAPCKYCC